MINLQMKKALTLDRRFIMDQAMLAKNHPICDNEHGVKKGR